MLSHCDEVAGIDIETFQGNLQQALNNSEALQAKKGHAQKSSIIDGHTFTGVLVPGRYGVQECANIALRSLVEVLEQAKDFLLKELPPAPEIARTNYWFFKAPGQADASENEEEEQDDDDDGSDDEQNDVGSYDEYSDDD